jgi:hypothetical protein
MLIVFFYQEFCYRSRPLKAHHPIKKVFRALFLLVLRKLYCIFFQSQDLYFFFFFFFFFTAQSNDTITVYFLIMAGTEATPVNLINCLASSASIAPYSN